MTINNVVVSCGECKRIDTCKDKIDARVIEDDIKYGFIVPKYIPGPNAECLVEKEDDVSMKGLFLSLEDAVSIAVREYDADECLARQEFEQKCYVNDDKYSIGYEDGLNDAIKSIENWRDNNAK